MRYSKVNGKELYNIIKIEAIKRGMNISTFFKEVLEMNWMNIFKIQKRNTISIKTRVKLEHVFWDDPEFHKIFIWDTFNKESAIKV